MRKSYKNILFGLSVLVLFLSQTVNAAGPSAVNLGSAGSFAILSKTGISTTGTTSIVGDIGVSPIAATAITGFGLILDSSNQFSLSSLVTGKVYAADYAAPTPTKMTTAVSDMQTAYTDAAGRTNPTAIELGAGNIGGMTIAPGLYKWGAGVTIPTSVTLSGGPNDVWIFQITQNLDVGDSAIITLSGGAQAQNVFWQVAGQATLGTTSDFKGIILSQTAIVLNTGAKLNGRALAQTAVTLNADAVTAPTGFATTTPTPTPTPTPTAVSTAMPTATPTSPVGTSTPLPSATPTFMPTPTGTASTPIPTGTTLTPTTPKPTAKSTATPAASIVGPITPVIGGRGGLTTTPMARPTAIGGSTGNAWSGIADAISALPRQFEQLEAAKRSMLFFAALLVILSAAGFYYYFKS